MTVVITGSSGFLGSALVKVFSGNNVRVIRLVRDDKIKSDSDNIHYVNYQKSLDDKDVAEKLTEFNPGVFIHCAWKGISGGERNESFQLEYNVPRTIESVRLAHASGCKQWIGAGSQAEYGNKSHLIFETEPACPLTLYGKAKLAAGASALELCNELGIKGVWNRIFSLYGQGDNINYFIPYVVNSLLQRRKPELTKCEQVWDYLFVNDAAEAFYAQCRKQIKGVFNLCSGIAISLKDVAYLIQRLLNDKSLIQFGSIPYSKDQTMVLSGNCDKLKNQTGWVPKTALEEGLEQTISYYRNLESI